MSKFYYTCIYQNKEISFDNKDRRLSTEKEGLMEILDQYSNKQIYLYLDANICTYITSFYHEPKQFAKDYGIMFFKEIKFLIETKHKYNLKIVPDFGLDESCRYQNNFKYNINKLNQSIHFIKEVTKMKYYDFENHYYSNFKFPEPLAKNDKFTISTKLNALVEICKESVFLASSYLALLKIQIIEFEFKELTGFEKFKHFFHFLENDLNLISSTFILVALNYWGNENENFEFTNKIRKAKTFIDKLKTSFNCAVDLSLPMRISFHANANNIIPIIVTADEKLSHIFLDNLQIKSKIYINDKLNPITSIALSKNRTNYTDEELNYIEDVMITKTAIRALGKKGLHANNILTLCEKLESQYKSYIE